ncbi:scramblase family protein [Cladophialophora carrionii]|uniref:Scramblase family protein n=1 Tax=Cladophialophora carrionii TaxID=86049 RepID=A0A1C1CB81_9EURO|nr:scramblase family protein [Cladophialophora carrionii]
MAKPMVLLSRSACTALKPRTCLSFVSRSFSDSSRRLLSADREPRKDHNASSTQGKSPTKPPSMEDVLANTDPKDNPLLAPVYIPEDLNAILRSNHPAAGILTQSAIVIQRQLEMMNLLVGFEQANRYVILDPQGNHIGYMAEHDGGISHTMRRQFFNTHRAFTTHVFDRNSREVLRFHRPFSWINTRIRVYDPWDTESNFEASTSTKLAESNSDPSLPPQISPVPLENMRVIGETHSQWAPLRRKYDLFLSHDLSLGDQGPGAMLTRSAEGLSHVQKEQVAIRNKSGSSTDFAQFARVDEPFLSWDFSLRDEHLRKIGTVNREFRGFGRELFTDTGSYVLRMDAAESEDQTKDQATNSPSTQGQPAQADVLGGSKFGMTLDQRAVMLATAVTIDYDYFSRHSGGHGFFPLWLGGGGGEAAGGAAGAGAAGAGEAAGAAGTVGAAEAGGAVVGAGRAVGTASGGAAGMGEGAMAGAGTMAGYEAMQRGMGRRSEAAVDDASPQQQPPEQPYGQPHDSQSPQSGFPEQNQEQDVWGTAESDPWSEGPQTGGSEGGEGGGWLSQLWDSFWNN